MDRYQGVVLAPGYSEPVFVEPPNFLKEYETQVSSRQYFFVRNSECEWVNMYDMLTDVFNFSKKTKEVEEEPEITWKTLVNPKLLLSFSHAWRGFKQGQ